MLRLNNAYRTPDFTNCDPNEEFICPYDPNHKIRAKRFPYHLRACRKNHPLSNTVSCPFNARHIVPGPEYKYHLTTCPDKRVIEQDVEYAHQKLHGEESTFKGCTDVPAYNSYIPPPCSEDWDEEIASERNYEYNSPDNFGSDIYRSTCGMTPAQKRAHREYLSRQEGRRKAGLPPEPEHFELDSVPELVPPTSHAPLRLPREPAKAYQQVNQNQMPIGGQNSKLGLIGLGRGVLMSKQMAMVNQIKADDEKATQPTPLGYGRGMAANFASAGNTSNGHANASEAQTYVRTMLGRGRGGTPQNRNRKPVPPVGGLANHKTPSSDAINIPLSPKKIEKEIEKKTNQAAVDSSSSLDESEDIMRKKLIRKLTKKLNGIKILEKSKEDGKTLTEEEELKISKKKEVEEQITVLDQET